MATLPGTRLGSYEILCAIGAGGMGEVYKVRDTRLDRIVAIKVLPEAFAHDPERLIRFQREAKLLASLNHPNIASIYGLEDSGSTHALVMELVEGPTLAERIASVGSVIPRSPGPAGATRNLSGIPIPIDEALPIAKQICDALEYAHEHGVVHRDLKPANIKISRDDSVKILDFGLAKAVQGEASEADPADSPTISHMATQAGIILGTAAYMSPEQAKGKPVDRRADIWAFGCVLYEMLAGKPAFAGQSVADTLAAVLKNEPDWSQLPKDTPTHVRVLLQRCLQKDPKQRLRDIGDARIALDEVLSGAAKELVPSAKAPAPVWRRVLPWALFGATAVALAAIVAIPRFSTPERTPSLRPLTRLNVDLGPEAMTGFNLTVAISPDGRRLVFPARGPDGQQELATQLLDQSSPTLLSGTEGGSDPFFSPDSQWIGFFAGSLLKTISVQGGAPVTLASVGFPVSSGGSWGADGNIIFASGGVRSLYQIPAAGGTPKPLTKLGPGEVTHRWPQFLPGGNAVLFTAALTLTSWNDANIEAVSLKTGQVKIVQHGGYYGRYLPNGYLVYVRNGTLFGEKFDVKRLEVTGAPVPLLDDVAANPTTAGGQFDFSSTGTFVYASGKSMAQTWQMAWLDSSGKLQPLLATPGTYSQPRLSPDGRQLAFVEGSDIYTYDSQRNSTTRLTFTGHVDVPTWAPDGRHLVFRSSSNGFFFYWIRSDGSGAPQLLLESPNIMLGWSLSPDGHYLAYSGGPNSVYDIWTLPLDLADPDHPKPGKPELFLHAQGGNPLARFSPDGRWIAYRSGESGYLEIYVRPFPPTSGGQWQISNGGALYALWSKDGHELFYETTDNRIMVVDYTVKGSAFVPGKPRLWSDKQLFYTGTSNLDLAPDGKRFVVLTTPQASGTETGTVHVTMLLNFFDQVKLQIP